MDLGLPGDLRLGQALQPFDFQVLDPKVIALGQ